MHFKGRLKLPGDRGVGILVDLRLDDIFLEVTSGTEQLGRWRMDEVAIERLVSNEFSLELNGEPLLFVADDALSFAYEGVAAIEDVSARLTKKRRGVGRRRRTDGSAAAPVSIPQISDTPRGAAETTVEPPNSVGSPAPVETVPAMEPVVVPEPPVAPPPVVLPDPVASPEPAVASHHWLRPEPETSFVESTIEAGTESGSEGGAEFGGAAVPTPAGAAPDRPDLVTVSDDAGSFAAEVAVIDLTEVATEVDMGAAGRAEPPMSMDTDEGGPLAVVLPLHAETLEAPVAPPPGAPPVAPSSEAERIVVSPPAHAEEALPEESRPEVARPGEAVERPSGGLHSLFGRRREKKAEPDHEHVFEESRTIGGITRRVCSTCGHVSFLGEDVYEGWR